MRLLTRLSRPLRATSIYEWAESCDLLLARKLGMDRAWLRPFESPQRNELPQLDHCFDLKSTTKAFELLDSYRGEIKSLPAALSLNEYFGPADVAFYWSFIRSRRPNKVIEVGSGYSSRVALRALGKNGSGQLICIDPLPRLHLPASNLTHIASKLEEIDHHLFDDFQPQDIFFIDSSHTATEVLNHAAILDRLPVGALVHYHDIDYPWGRPQPDWNEDAAVSEFLVARPNWKAIVSGSILSRDYLPQLRNVIPSYRYCPYRRYNALWIMRER